MLLAVGVIVWRWRSLGRRPMQRRQGKQGSRCRVLFSDLKVFLLRPPTPSAPPPAFTPMNGLNAEGNATSSAASTDGSLANGHHRPVGRSSTAPPPGEPSEGTGSEDWAHGKAEAPRSLDGCSSSDDCSKEKFDERLSLNSCTDSGVRTPLCRICFQGPEQGELLSPCRCSGSVRCTHEPCLIKWISERGSWSCELCYYKYQVIAISTKNPLQWQTISLTVIEKVQIAAAVLGSLFLIASISWLVWSSLSPSAKWQRQDLLFQICYAMYGFMDLVCIALIVHEGPSVFRIFNRWQAVNQQWKVLNYDKVRDTDDPQKGGSSTLRALTLPLSNRATTAPPPGTGPSPSTSSLMAAAMTPATAVPPVAGTTPEDAVEAGNGLAPPLMAPPPMDHHCTYSLLQLLSQHLRSQERRASTPASPTSSPPPAPANGQPSNGNRELVMRVTTV
ncbi:E3 ubiquitin-protein ligase MARCHF4 [Brachyhypopomus gauderio]|uniref:E3 ubiquitin-protein ligase MARCHF4 n=1 Tax=Brachyhypopomus gauderio TaxID=698409 RepID=UPI0040421F3C